MNYSGRGEIKIGAGPLWLTRAFKGNVGIQCATVKGDKRKYVERTMKTWREIVAKLNE